MGEEFSPAIVAAFAAIVTGLLALTGVMTGHFVKNRQGVEAARVEVQRVEIEQQRADIDGLSRVVESLKTLVELQEKRINAMAETIGIASEDLDHERRYTHMLTEHIEAHLPPPPPPRPSRHKLEP